ncbi:IS1595 family transposase [Pseudorhodoplanes sp.]|uniref:IS1595 family transposase n=1 Tax=Pseudorhodoplanes sp. TaxID=1934341 RepID=UPI003D1452CD
MSALSAPHLHNEEAAIAKLESIVWPNGPVCPHCGNANETRIYKIKGKSARPGLRTCGECRKQFTVKIGTLFESSHVPVFKWWQAVHLMTASKKGISAHQLHRTLKVTYKTAWFMAHRIREAMRASDLAPMGGNGGIVEVDETFIGRKKGVKVERGFKHKFAVLTLVDRKGEARSFHVDNVRAKTVVPILKKNIDRESRIATDEARQYEFLKYHFADHQALKHVREEWVRGEFSTNRAEGFFSVFKRGMKGVYQHCSEKHLHRYLAEFDFRYNNRSARGVEDDARADRAARGIVGKRLKYRDSSP